MSLLTALLFVLCILHPLTLSYESSEIGLMTSAAQLSLDDNALNGAIPSELGQMTSLGYLWLESNQLSGTVPLEFDALVLNHSLQLLRMEGNNITGLLSQALCSLGPFNSTIMAGISFDCSNDLCGCSWCPCPELR